MSVLIWVSLSLCALWMAFRLLPVGWDWKRPLPELIALIPLLTGPLVILALLSILSKAWPQLVIALVLLAIEIAWHLPLCKRIPAALLSTLVGLPASSQAAQPAVSSKLSPLHIMTLNCRFGRADAAAIVNAVRQEKLDLLALQELTEEMLIRLQQAGLDKILPFSIRGPKTSDDNGGFNALYSRQKPQDLRATSVSLPASAVPTMTLQTLGTNIIFASAHPKSPQRGGSNWGASILALANLNPSFVSKEGKAHAIPCSDTQQEVVVLGDLNSSIFHPSLRKLLSSGHLLDGAVSVHQGLHPTFPASWKCLPPLIEIDHILHTSGLGLISLRSLPIAGSDHLALVGKLVAVPKSQA